MDAGRFERFLRILTTSPSRRQALGGLAIAVLGGMLGHDPLAVTAKGKKGKGGKKGKRGKKKAKTKDPGPPTCSDGIKNGTETGVDCGGGTCPRCATGQGCAQATDCASSFCGSGTCQVCQDLTQPCGTDSAGACSCYPQANEDLQFVRYTCIRPTDFTFPATPECEDDRVFVFTSGNTFACAKPCGAPL